MDTQSGMPVQVDPETGEVLDTIHNPPDETVWSTAWFGCRSCHRFLRRTGSK